MRLEQYIDETREILRTTYQIFIGRWYAGHTGTIYRTCSYLMYDEDPPTLFRLNALMKAGFKIDEVYSQQLEDSIQLKHPAMKRLNDYELTLYPDGLVTGSYGRDQLRIESDQQKEFNAFLRTVPKPTWLESTLDIRVKIFTWFLLAMIFLAPTVWNSLS